MNEKDAELVEQARKHVIFWRDECRRIHDAGMHSDNLDSLNLAIKQHDLAMSRWLKAIIEFELIVSQI